MTHRRRSHSLVLAMLGILLPAAALCGLGAVVLVERDGRAREEATARATETAAQGKRWIEADLERVERRLQERLHEPRPLLASDDALWFDLIRAAPDAPWALLDGPPRAVPMRDPEASGQQIDWTLFVPEIERLEFSSSAEQAATRYGQLATAMAARPSSHARLLLLQAGACQRAGNWSAAADALATLVSTVPPDALLDHVPLVFACRLERTLMLARFAAADARAAALELLADLHADRIAMPASEVAAHMHHAMNELRSVVGDEASTLVDAAAMANRARAERLARLISDQASRVLAEGDRSVVVTQLADPPTRVSVAVIEVVQLARSLQQVPVARGFQLALSGDLAHGPSSAPLEGELRRLTVAASAPSEYVADLLLPWRLAIFGGVGVVALVAIVSAWLSARAVRRELELAAMRGELVTSISHELRTPLTSILVNAELLEDARVDDVAKRRYIERIHESARRLRALVERVLDFARWNRGDVPATKTLLDPATLVTAAMEEMAELLRDHPVACEVAADLPRIVADRDVLVQVLVGLLDNAVKYGGKCIPITVRVRVASNHDVVLQVEDRGIGVAAAERAHLFEPFFRSPRTSEQVPGVGLGLAFAQRVVRAHGGDLTAEPAAPGTSQEGLRVTLRLPAARDGEAA